MTVMGFSQAHRRSRGMWLGGKGGEASTSTKVMCSEEEEEEQEEEEEEEQEEIDQEAGSETRYLPLPL